MLSDNTLLVRLSQSMCNCLCTEGGGSLCYEHKQGCVLVTTDVKVRAVIRCCSLNDAQGSLISDLLPELRNKRLSCVQLGSLLCQPAIQSF